jgi:hypothetical protein
MATERQRRMVLGGILVVLAIVLYRAWTSPVTPAPGTTSATSRTASNARGRAAPPARSDGPPAEAPDVHLEALDAQRPEPGGGNRNLFRFRPKPLPPTPAPVDVPPPSVMRQMPVVPSGPPPPPPIPLKFIGIVEAPAQAKRIAALVDPLGRAFQGGEGDVVAGQYRILKIGTESIELAYLDGRGRQTIRLSGS